MGRLGQNIEFMSFRTRFLEKIGGGGLSGEEKNLASRQDVPDLDSRFDPIHVRHDDIADDQVRPAGASAIDGFRAGVDGRGIKAILVEDDDSP